MTAERFPVGESRDTGEDDDWTKNGVSSSSSEAEDRSLLSGSDVIRRTQGEMLESVVKPATIINQSINYSISFFHCLIDSYGITAWYSKLRLQ